MSDSSAYTCYTLLGPTGVGKSELAHKLALEESMPILSCDAMYLYQGMNIGTAKTE